MPVVRQQYSLRSAPARATVLVIVALVVVHLVQPTGPVGDGSFLVAGWGAAVLAWLGARRASTESRLIPHLVAIGLTLSATADLVFLIYVWRGETPDISSADVAYLASYVALGAALVVVTLIRTPTGVRLHTDTVIDALTIIVVSVLVFWDLSIAEIVADETLSAGVRVVWAAYPILDAVVLALALRALASRRRRALIGPLFVFGMGCWLVSDVGYLLTSVSGATTALLDSGWMLGAALIMTSAWRRRDVADTETQDVVEVSNHGLWTLAIGTVPLVVPLALHSLNSVLGRDPRTVATMLSMGCLIALAFWRSARLLRSEQVARSDARASRDVALEASRAKSAFLATMSHEIRTPMNGVIGLTSLLQETALDQRQREYADGVHVAGEALLRIINDILDFSKVEAGKLELDIIDFDLRQVVEETAGLVAESAHGKGLELLAYCSPEVPLDLCGDPARLRQVLLNLASNAVKFTEDGEVVIRAHLEGQTERGPVVRFEVIDTGLGLAETDRGRLFDPFSQADSSTTRRFGGTGLGLAICHQLVTAMGGELGVDSEVGRGSTFWFTIPFEVADTRPDVTPLPPADVLTGLRVLVVDDNHTNRLILSDQLGVWGICSAVATDGASALEELERAAAAGAPYAVALLDLCMPDMDGLELAHRISAIPALEDIQLVLLTSGPSDSAQEARSAGIAVCLTKPVHLSRLRKALLEVADTALGPAAAPSVPSASPRPAGRGHVLVAEDNEINQMVAEGILLSLGYSIEIVENGQQVLDAVARTIFDAVLMDCQMPEMDGYDATVELRRREPESSHLAVIAMTASVTEGERERCAAAGMDDYLSKPVSTTELRTVLARWVPTRQV